MERESALLWQPTESAIEVSQMSGFRRHVNTSGAQHLLDYRQLYQYSVTNIADFWSRLWDYCDVRASKKGSVALNNNQSMLKAEFFPEAQLNFAENLLVKGRDEDEAIVFINEDEKTIRLSYGELKGQVAALAHYLKTQGVVKGDHVAAYLPNTEKTIIAMLATTSLGAVWSSCSPDFGVPGVVDRLSQVKPKVLFATDGYLHKGKIFDMSEKNQAVLSALDSVQVSIMMPLLNNGANHAYTSVSLESIQQDYKDSDLFFEQLGFNDPLYILFSSGTTGTPKCIVHGVGGTLLQHLKEHRLHLDLKPRERFFYATTCGWMMWNWMVSALASGATLILYEGAPLYPKRRRFFDLIEAEKINILGVSAKYIDVLRKANISSEGYDLSSLRALLSTGSPLVPEAFDYVYDNIKQDICLSSISGGTDIISCFVLGSNVLGVYRGEIQCRGLGMAVESWDGKGNSQIGEKGELVCTKPFPSMPIGFLNDPTGERYRSAYFDRFENTWCHGDYLEINERGGVVIHGRSDTTLNPGGIRIGTAEIYRQVEIVEEVSEALVIGQQWQDDVRIVLFVTLLEGVELDNQLKQKIRTQIRQNTTPHHNPKVIIAVPEIPRTLSGKIVELAVKAVVEGKEIDNKEALLNPDALDFFANLKELQ
ncbi:MAG: acetoacetate--CoA ligase [Gammaproteobacteria bacterium]|nr:acetoacetate--CoA ligase [Gammaproteobacteria bacterium]